MYCVYTKPEDDPCVREKRVPYWLWQNKSCVWAEPMFVSTVQKICYKYLHGVGFCGDLSFWRMWASGHAVAYDGIFWPWKWGISPVRNVDNLINLHGVIYPKILTPELEP